MIRAGKGERLPCDIGHGSHGTGYLDAEPQAKAIEGNNGPGVIDARGSDNDDFAQAKYPGYYETADRMQTNGWRKCNEDTHGKSKRKFIRRVIQMKNAPDAVPDIYHRSMPYAAVLFNVSGDRPPF
jgi:hypothetical protein